MARREIFEIHTREKPLVDDVDLDELATKTDGLVGADIAAVCREAATIAVREYVRGTSEGRTSVDDIVLTRDHFDQALETVDTSQENEFEEELSAV